MAYLGETDTIPYLTVLKADRGLFHHWGIYMGDSRVFHCTPEYGEHISTLKDFQRDRRMYLMSPPAGRRYIIPLLISRHLRHPRRYNLLSNNCEQIVRAIVCGLHESKELQGWTLGLVGVALFALAQSDN